VGRRARVDAVIVGGGHNGLVAATLLARAGRTVLVLERRLHVGGAAVSGEPFAGVGARLSRYAYLVSLFPRGLADRLGLRLELRPRAVPFYAPGVPGEDEAALSDFQAMLAHVSGRLFPTLTEPLRSREELRRLLGHDEAWEALFENPLSDLLERTFSSDTVRGLVLTDGLIGTFAPADDPLLRQNRCFLYHLGRWDVPVGGMGAVTGELESAARAAGVEIQTSTEVVSITPDGEVASADGRRFYGRDVLVNAAPPALSELLGEQGEPSEGSQLKINMLLARLPCPRDPAVTPEQAFTGTFHINESYEQLDQAYEQAAAGEIPTLPPCEMYCHSLTDSSILSPELRAAGAHTLTLFGLHMPARLFADAPAQRKREAVAATLRSVDTALTEPLEDCLLRDADGNPCLEALTPSELEAELGMPGGHIFHQDLAWPHAEREEEVGSWGVETAHPHIWLCGAGARRGGGVSGIPGHNAARAVLASGV
jgi:phytoene dehydrogenase-like protein